MNIRRLDPFIGRYIYQNYGLNKEIEAWCVLFEKIDQVIKM